jgi:hypothetical protein
MHQPNRKLIYITKTNRLILFRVIIVIIVIIESYKINTTYGQLFVGQCRFVILGSVKVKKEAVKVKKVKLSLCLTN